MPTLGLLVEGVHYDGKGPSYDTRRRIMNWTLEVVVVPVSDVDRAKAFYAEQLGFNVDHDTKVSEGNRIVQLTPPGSGCSIVVGEGIVPDMAPGSLKGLQLVVPDLHAAARSARTARREGQRDPGLGGKPQASAGPSRQRRVLLLRRSGRQRVGRTADLCPRSSHPVPLERYQTAAKASSRSGSSRPAPWPHRSILWRRKASRALGDTRVRFNSPRPIDPMRCCAKGSITAPHGRSHDAWGQQCRLDVRRPPGVTMEMRRWPMSLGGTPRSQESTNHWRPRGARTGESMGQPVVHFEIIGRDGKKLQDYYSELFEWRIDADNPMNYGMVDREQNVNSDGVGIGGGVGVGPEGYEGHVTFYVEVPDVEAALAKAESLGGSRLMGPG